MRNVFTRTSIIKVFALVSILSILTAMAPPPEQEKGVAGKWKLTIDFDGREMNNTLFVCTAKEGQSTVKWGLGGREDEISDIKLEDNKLSFVRTVRWGEREFSSTFKATYDKQTDKLTGTLSSERGDSDVTGTRIIPKPDAIGTWNMKMERGDRVSESTLTIKQKPDGKLEGKWTSQRGESEVSNIKFEKVKLTFKRVRKFEDREFKSTFEGEVKGNELKGELTSQRGSRPITGKRFGAEVIGKWELTTVSERGERTSILLIDKDLTAIYGMGFGEINVNKIKLETDKMTFTVGMEFGDRDFRMDFDLKLTGDKLEGEVSSDRGTSKVTGKKIVEKPKDETPKPVDKPTETQKEE